MIDVVTYNWILASEILVYSYVYLRRFNWLCFISISPSRTSMHICVHTFSSHPHSDGSPGTFSSNLHSEKAMKHNRITEMHQLIARMFEPFLFWFEQKCEWWYEFCLVHITTVRNISIKLTQDTCFVDRCAHIVQCGCISTHLICSRNITIAVIIVISLMSAIFGHLCLQARLNKSETNQRPKIVLISNGASLWASEIRPVWLREPSWL